MEKFTRNGKVFCYHYNPKYCNICFRFIAVTLVRVEGSPLGKEVFVGASDDSSEAYEIARAYAKAHNATVILRDKNPYKWRRKYSSCLVFPND